MGIKTPASIKKIIGSLCQGNKALTDTAFNLLHELGDYEVTVDNGTIWTITVIPNTITYDGSYGGLLLAAENIGYTEPAYTSPRYDDGDTTETDIHQWGQDRGVKFIATT